MQGWVQFILFSVVLGLIMWRQIMATDCYESQPYIRKLNKKLCEIESAINHSKTEKSFTFNHKNKSFVICTRESDSIKSIRYSGLSDITSKEILINDEVVGKITTVHFLWRLGYHLEYTSKRNMIEIEELINVAYKSAKQFERQYYKQRLNSELNDNSFYK